MDQTELKVLVDEKLTARQIGERIGKSEHAVRRLLTKYNLKTFRHISRNSNNTHKLCRYCEQTKPIADFPLARTVKGKKYYRQKCQPCYRQSKKDRVDDIRRWFLNIKKTLKCVQCGNDDFRVLEFHHHSDDKEANIADLVGSGNSRESILTEMAKCDPVCANCHRIIHFDLSRGEMLE